MLLALQFSLFQDERSGPRHVMPTKHVYAERKLIEHRRQSLRRDVAMQHKAIAPCNTSNNVEKAEGVGEGKHCAALGADKSLAGAECLEAVNALWHAAFNFCDVTVLLYSRLEKMFAY